MHSVISSIYVFNVKNRALSGKGGFNKRKFILQFQDSQRKIFFVFLFFPANADVLHPTSRPIDREALTCNVDTSCEVKKDTTFDYMLRIVTF